MKTQQENKTTLINQRAREIRYGDGCSAEEALRRATQEFEEWAKCS